MPKTSLDLKLPAEARLPTWADIPKILELLRPAGRYHGGACSQGVDVHAFNQRTVAEIFDMIRMVGAADPCLLAWQDAQAR
jgi:hypothetical protein